MECPTIDIVSLMRLQCAAFNDLEWSTTNLVHCMYYQHTHKGRDVPVHWWERLQSNWSHDWSWYEAVKLFHTTFIQAHICGPWLFCLEKWRYTKRPPLRTRSNVLRTCQMRYEKGSVKSVEPNTPSTWWTIKPKPASIHHPLREL